MAALTRFNPFWELERFERTVDRLFDDAWAPTPLTWRFDFDPWFTPARFALPDLSVALTRPIRVEDEGDAIRVELPAGGVRPEEISVEEQNGWLTIRAERRMDASWERAGWRMWEGRAGLWAHTLRLPDAVQADKAEARLENGVLTIRLPKRRAFLSLPKPELGRNWLGRVKDAVVNLAAPKNRPKRLSVRVKRS
ncbi:MAG: Hsp20/alpha crystallin family protein [Caldilineae bacterium]|nr:MAG: Hsp20/alpha crystallin family protein [Caldilineae bacterium]